jgi:hypothetical protein
MRATPSSPGSRAWRNRTSHPLAAGEVCPAEWSSPKSKSQDRAAGCSRVQPVENDPTLSH